MKWSLLIQPRNPLFWLLCVINGLSAGLSWIAQNRPLGSLVLTLVVVTVLANAVLGVRVMWLLMREDPVPEAPTQARIVSEAE